MPTAKDIVVKKTTEEESAACKSWPVWACEPSKFDWDYTQTETCLVLEGKVTVSDRPATGEAVTFGPGDLVVFPVDLRCTWKVQEPVKKHYNFS